MRGLALFVLLSFAAVAAAQLRTIPPEAKLGQIRHLQEMQIELDGKPRMLSAGAQIRDADNRVVVPASVQQMVQVRYLLDQAGQVHRVWILSPRETAALPSKPRPQ